jgi:hypothetical protein
VQNDIADSAWQVFEDSGLGGRIELHQGHDSDYWTLWYVLPQMLADSHGRTARVVLSIYKVGAKLYRPDADSAERVLGSEITLEGSGATLRDFPHEELNLANALMSAQRLIDWAKTKFGVVTDGRAGMVNIVSDVFMASGLKGTLFPHENDHMTDVCYILEKKPGERESVVLTVSTNKNHSSPLIVADACEEESGVVLFKLPLKPMTEENMRIVTQELVDWAKSR